jgi:hypothetical protein
LREVNSAVGSEFVWFESAGIVDGEIFCLEGTGRSNPDWAHNDGLTDTLDFHRAKYHNLTLEHIEVFVYEANPKLVSESKVSYDGDKFFSSRRVVLRQVACFIDGW